MTRGNYPAPEKALEVVRIGIMEGLEAGYAAEADRFGQLAVSREAKALMSIFFATNELKKDNGTDDPSVQPREVGRLFVQGGGLMGAGVAYVASALEQVPVRIKGKDDEGVRRALSHVRGLYDERVKKKSITWRERDARMALVTATADYSGFKQCDVVI